MRKLMVLFCLAALCPGGTSAAKGARAPAPWSPDDTAPMTGDVASAAARAQAIHCRTPSCKAIIVIHELIDIGTFEAGPPVNGTAGLYLGDRPRIAGRRLDRVLLDHPDLYGPVCAMGGRLLSRFRLAPGIYEMDVPVQLLVNAVDMDLRDHGHCARDLLESLPDDPANDQVRSNARILCDSDSENHDRPRAACAVLDRTVRTGQ